MKANQITRIVNALAPYFNNYVLYAPYVVGEDKEFECYPVTEFKLSFLRRNQKFEVLIKTGSTKDAPLELQDLIDFLTSHPLESSFNVLVGETNEDASHVNSFVLIPSRQMILFKDYDFSLNKLIEEYEDAIMIL